MRAQIAFQDNDCSSFGEIPRSRLLDMFRFVFNFLRKLRYIYDHYLNSLTDKSLIAVSLKSVCGAYLVLLFGTFYFLPFF